MRFGYFGLTQKISKCKVLIIRRTGVLEILVDIILLHNLLIFNVLIKHQMRCFALFFLTRFHKSSQNSNLIELVFIEIKIVVLGQSQLIKVIVKSLFGIPHFLSCTFQCVNSFSLCVNFFIKLSPLLHSINGFFDRSFLDFLFLLFRWAWFFSANCFRNKFSVVNLNLIFHKQLILKQNLLIKRVLANENVHSSELIVIKNVRIRDANFGCMDLAQGSGYVNLSRSR